METQNGDFKSIEKQLFNEIDEHTQESSSDNGPKTPPPRPEGFIPDRVLTFLLGLKNGAFLSFLEKGVGEETKADLKAIYTPDADEFKLYRECLEDFIREHYSEYIGDLRKMNTGLAALFLFESIRLKSALDLKRTDPRVRKPDIDVKATVL